MSEAMQKAACNSNICMWRAHNMVSMHMTFVTMADKELAIWRPCSHCESACPLHLQEVYQGRLVLRHCYKLLPIKWTWTRNLDS